MLKKSQNEEINFIYPWIFFQVNQRKDIQDIPAAELQFTHIPYKNNNLVSHIFASHTSEDNYLAVLSRTY